MDLSEPVDTPMVDRLKLDEDLIGEFQFRPNRFRGMVKPTKKHFEVSRMVKIQEEVTSGKCLAFGDRLVSLVINRSQRRHGNINIQRHGILRMSAMLCLKSFGCDPQFKDYGFGPFIKFLVSVIQKISVLFLSNPTLPFELPPSGDTAGVGDDTPLRGQFYPLLNPPHPPLVLDRKKGLSGSDNPDTQFTNAVWECLTHTNVDHAELIGWRIALKTGGITVREGKAGWTGGGASLQWRGHFICGIVDDLVKIRLSPDGWAVDGALWGAPDYWFLVRRDKDLWRKSQVLSRMDESQSQWFGNGNYQNPRLTEAISTILGYYLKGCLLIF
ncbi:hypothetical protein Tco_1336388 [Tanacetum coccineum]